MHLRFRVNVLSKRRLLPGSLLLAVLAVLYLRPADSRAQPPPRPHPYRWIEGLDGLHALEGGAQLSRPVYLQRAPEIPLPGPSYALHFTHYPTWAEMVMFLHQLEAAHPGWMEVRDIGRSALGQPLLTVRLGCEGHGDPDLRPALYVDGGLHANEASSTQAALYVVWYLASHYGSDPLVTRLLDTRTVYAVPCFNPDGNDVFLQSDQWQRKTANPTASDDDGDGQYDEDGREGAGYGSREVYRYEFQPQWVADHGDDPFFAGWQEHLLDRTFLGIFDDMGREVLQLDDDADGSTSEDPPGGVDPNRNFDVHWELGCDDPAALTYHGPAAFSEAETRAVRDFVLARTNIWTASSVQSGSDTLAHPWAWSTQAALPDALWYELLSRKGSQLTEANGFQGTPHTWTARGLYVASGSEMDWLCEQGIMAWTPEIYGASEVVAVQRINSANAYRVGLSIGAAYNPPAEELPLTVDRWLDWHLYLLAATPNVGLHSAKVQDSVLTLTVGNDGLLPLDVEVTVEMGPAVYTHTLEHLSAGLGSWAMSLPTAAQAHTATVTLAGRSHTLSLAGPLQSEVLSLDILGQHVQVLQGRLEPFVELGEPFGGWFAGREWDGPEYHLGPPLLYECFLPAVGQLR